MITKSIHKKLIFGFCCLLAIILIIGLVIITQLNILGNAIDVILKENYKSVIACQNMKEALERIDSNLLFNFIGKETTSEINEYIQKFEEALNIEINNITLTGELEKANKIKLEFSNYKEYIKQFSDISLNHNEREHIYFQRLLPLFNELKNTAQDILNMNQTNMHEANNFARQQATLARRRMLSAFLICGIIAILFSYLSYHWILKPIKKLSESVNKIKDGNLDIVLETKSKDELGQLSESFNEMTSALKLFRQKEEMNLQRSRQTTNEVFKTLPAAIAITDLDGKIEVSTETAKKHFGLDTGIFIKDLKVEWLQKLFNSAMTEKRVTQLDSKNEYIQHFINNQEYFFQPMVLTIPVGSKQPPTGITIILRDVTQVVEKQELKRGLLSTLSHQLKTPLTSLRMSILLLLEEKIGQLNPSQSELLKTARNESDRLLNVLNDLMNIDSIESGKYRLNIKPESPFALAAAAVKTFTKQAESKNIELINEVQFDLNKVLADASKIQYVFSNFISNALRFTKSGGAITIKADDDVDYIKFYISDTGEGIPAEHINHIFEQFYRVPGQDESSGIGLGLSIVKKIIKAHNGKTGVESEYGKGATFWFTLPQNILKI